MGAGHDHGVRSLGDRHKGRLWAAASVLAVFVVVEVAGGLYTGSLALLSDAGHMFTDLLGIGMALAAITAVRGAAASRQRTFGLYRLEVLAALANAALLLAVATYVLVQAVRRFTEPPEVRAGPMLLFALAGLAATAASFLLLRPGAGESLNVRGAYLEVLGDMVNAAGVVVAALVIRFTGWWYADPIIAVLAAALILPRTVKLAWEAIRILVQAAPAGLDVTAVQHTLAAVPGVQEVHDLHVWTLTSGMEVASAHLALCPDADYAEVLTAARTSLHDGFHIAHATLQVEPAGADQDCRAVGW